jgi:hypothetical protein
MPAFGFTHTGKSTEPSGVVWRVFSLKEKAGQPGQFFAITEDKNHTPNRNCIAFFVESRERVDQIADIAREAGTRNIEGPCECPEYNATYYAVFFEDPSGNRLEAVNWKLGE